MHLLPLLFIYLFMHLFERQKTAREKDMERDFFFPFVGSLAQWWQQAGLGQAYIWAPSWSPTWAVGNHVEARLCSFLGLPTGNWLRSRATGTPVGTLIGDTVTQHRTP